MRHNKAINHLGRKSGHRKALLANMANSLILHKRITTTLAKAKALKTYLEPLITKSKDDSTHSRRIVFSYLKDKTAVAELFRTIAPKIADRPGGYLRVLHVGFRQGDGSEMALISTRLLSLPRLPRKRPRRQLAVAVQRRQKLLRRLKLQQQRHLQQKLKRLLKLSNQEIRPDIVKALTIEFAGAFSFLQEKYRQKHDSSKKILTLY